MDQEQRQQVARAVKARRLDRGWSVASAARRAEIDRVTWQRVEDARPVQDVKLRQVQTLLGIEDDQTPGGLLRRARAESGMTEREMAEVLGVGPKAIKAWESGDDMPANRVALLRRLFTPDEVLDAAAEELREQRRRGVNGANGTETPR